MSDSPANDLTKLTVSCSGEAAGRCPGITILGPMGSPSLKTPAIVVECLCKRLKAVGQNLDSDYWIGG